MPRSTQVGRRGQGRGQGRGQVSCSPPRMSCLLLFYHHQGSPFRFSSLFSCFVASPPCATSPPHPLCDRSLPAARCPCFGDCSFRPQLKLRYGTALVVLNSVKEKQSRDEHFTMVSWSRPMRASLVPWPKPPFTGGDGCASLPV